MGKLEPRAMRAVFTPPLDDVPAGDFRGVALFEPEHRLPSDVDVILLPAKRFEQLIKMWELQVVYLRSQEHRAAEADRLQLCLDQIGSLFLHAHFDTTEKAS